MNIVTHNIHLRSPMSHGSLDGDTGNVSLFRRIPVVSPGGRHYRIPALSAGALRGVVRRILWRETFSACGVSRESLDSGSWDRLYAALANGGTIEASESRVSPDKIRERRASLPVLSLLGSALYTSHMAGHAQVSNSWLVCRESIDCGLVDSLRAGRDQSSADLVSEETRVRHVDQEEQSPDASGVGPMPTTVEVVTTGASLAGRAVIRGEIEAAAWAHAIEQVSHLGGKSAAGFGEVEISHDGDAGAYVDWLQRSVDDGSLRERLLTLASELGPAKKAKKAKAKK